jgi:DVNP family
MAMSKDHFFQRKIKNPVQATKYLKGHCDVDDVYVDADNESVTFTTHIPMTEDKAWSILQGYHDRNLRAQVMNKKLNSRGELITTAGGLTVDDITQNSRGKYVSKYASDLAKRTEPLELQLWRTAMVDARKGLKVQKGTFVPIKKGTELYDDTKRRYEDLLYKFQDEIKERRNVREAILAPLRAENDAEKQRSKERRLAREAMSPEQRKAERERRAEEIKRLKAQDEYEARVSISHDMPSSSRCKSPSRRRSKSPSGSSPSPKSRTPTPKAKTPTPKAKTPTPKAKTPTPKAKSPKAKSPKANSPKAKSPKAKSSKAKSPKAKSPQKKRERKPRSIYSP